MRVELDHLFVCANVGAPEAEELIQFGLSEGLPNQHPGQGSACRRFPFLNAMIELFWVSDATEARNQSTRRTLLWERWTERKSGACPFGICVRPADSKDGDSEIAEPPFPAWTYRPAYLTDPLVMHIGEAPITEPMWVYMGFMRRAYREAQFVEHRAGVRSITGLIMMGPRPLQSAASQKMIEDGILSTREGEAPCLEIEFDNNQRKQTTDFRPLLPIILKI